MNVLKVFANLTYSVNQNAIFPQFGRFLTGLGNGCLPIFFGQIVLQIDTESRGANYILGYVVLVAYLVLQLVVLFYFVQVFLAG